MVLEHNAVMEFSASYSKDLDDGSKTVSYSYRSFEYQQKQQDLLAHYQNFVDKISEDEIEISERTRLLKRPKDLPREVALCRKLVIMVACLFLHMTASGAISMLGVVYVDIIRVFDSPRSQAALIQSVNTGMTIGGGVLFTSVIQKYGTGVSVMVASAVAGLSYITSSFAQNVPTLIALIGVVAGSAMSVNFLSAFITIGRTFPSSTKTALAFLMLGSTGGQISFPYISQFLVNYFYWDGSLVILGAFILNSIPCGLIIYSSAQYFHQNTTARPNLCETICDCVKDYLFMTFLVVGFLFAALAPLEMWFIVDLTVLKGFEITIGTTLLSLLGVFGFFGRVCGALFLKIFKNTDSLIHASYSYVLFGVARYLISYFNQFWGMLLAVVLRGLSAGIIIAVMPGNQIELRGIEKYPQTVAIGNLVGGCSQILGGLLGGATVDITGGYDFVFTLGAIMLEVCAALTIIVWLLRRRKLRKIASSTSEYTITDEDTSSDKDRLISKQSNTKHG